MLLLLVLLVLVLVNQVPAAVREGRPCDGYRLRREDVCEANAAAPLLMSLPPPAEEMLWR